eukprot:2288838-Prymnesium_polylepis.2
MVRLARHWVRPHEDLFPLNFDSTSHRAQLRGVCCRQHFLWCCCRREMGSTACACSKHSASETGSGADPTNLHGMY